MEHLINKIMTKNDFPQYSDGDVLVCISPEQQYQLHSTTLRTNSETFRNLLTEDSAVVLAPKARNNGVKTRWRIELKLPNLQADETHAGDLILRELDPQARPRHKNTSVLSTRIHSGADKPALYTHYDNLLRAYYHHAPKFSTSSFGAALRNIHGLADVAETLGSIPCISAAVDIALLNQGDTLYRAVANDAAAWVELAVRIRSETLFRESIIHLVGQWNALSTPTNTAGAAALSNLRPEVLALCTRKAAELDEKKKAIELRILGHYPASIQTLQHAAQNVGPGSRTIRGAGQATSMSAYSTRVLDWMALNLFRHWLGQSIAGEMSRRGSDGGFAFYSAISKGGEEYINQSARESFCRHFPLSAKARTHFDRCVWEIKEAVKGYVGELVGSRVKLQVKEWPVGWLTCMGVEGEECPWVEEEAMRRAREGMFGVQEEATREERLRAERERRKTQRQSGNGVGSEEGHVADDEADDGLQEGLELLKRRQRHEDRMKKAKGEQQTMGQQQGAEGEGQTITAEDNSNNADESDADFDDSKWGGNAFATNEKRKRSGSAGTSDNERETERTTGIIDVSLVGGTMVPDPDTIYYNHNPPPAPALFMEFDGKIPPVSYVDAYAQKHATHGETIQMPQHLPLPHAQHGINLMQPATTMPANNYFLTPVLGSDANADYGMANTFDMEWNGMEDSNGYGDANGGMDVKVKGQIWD